MPNINLDQSSSLSSKAPSKAVHRAKQAYPRTNRARRLPMDFQSKAQTRQLKPPLIPTSIDDTITQPSNNSCSESSNSETTEYSNNQRAESSNSQSPELVNDSRGDGGSQHGWHQSRRSTSSGERSTPSEIASAFLGYKSSGQQSDGQQNSGQRSDGQQNSGQFASDSSTEFDYMVHNSVADKLKRGRRIDGGESGIGSTWQLRGGVWVEESSHEQEGSEVQGGGWGSGSVQDVPKINCSAKARRNPTVSCVQQEGSFQGVRDQDVSVYEQCNGVQQQGDVDCTGELDDSVDSTRGVGIGVGGEKASTKVDLDSRQEGKEDVFKWDEMRNAQEDIHEQVDLLISITEPGISSASSRELDESNESDEAAESAPINTGFVDDLRKQLIELEIQVEAKEQKQRSRQEQVRALKKEHGQFTDVKLQQQVTLTNEQKRVVTADPNKHQLIHACSGSGKTFSMIQRVKWLVSEHRIEPSSIVFITFTRSAAGDLKSRMVECSQSLEAVQCNTIDAHAKNVLTRYTSFQDDDQDVSEYGFMLNKFLNQGSANQNVKEYYNDVTHLIVDEIQDIDPVQAQIILHHAANGVIVSLTGDKSQNLYNFRGSDTKLAEINMSIIGGLPGQECNTFNLTKNFRSSPQIIDLANYIAREIDQSCPDMQPGLPMAKYKQNKLGKPILERVLSYRYPQSLRGIIFRYLGMGYKKKEIAVLCPTHSGLYRVEDHLEGCRVVYKIRESVNKNEGVSTAVKHKIQDAVTLTTIHQAKGLEWPVVICMYFDNKMMPSSRLGPADIQEGRQLLYVACTRAKDVLHMTYSDMFVCKDMSVLLQTVLKKNSSLVEYQKIVKSAVQEDVAEFVPAYHGVRAPRRDVAGVVSEFFGCDYYHLLTGERPFEPINNEIAKAADENVRNCINELQDSSKNLYALSAHESARTAQQRSVFSGINWKTQILGGGWFVPEFVWPKDVSINGFEPNVGNYFDLLISREIGLRYEYSNGLNGTDADILLERITLTKRYSKKRFPIFYESQYQELKERFDANPSDKRLSDLLEYAESNSADPSLLIPLKSVTNIGENDWKAWICNELIRQLEVFHDAEKGIMNAELRKCTFWMAQISEFTRNNRRRLITAQKNRTKRYEICNQNLNHESFSIGYSSIPLYLEWVDQERKLQAEQNSQEIDSVEVKCHEYYRCGETGLSGNIDMRVGSTLVDYKCSQSQKVRPEWLVQLLLYVYLCRQNGVHINKICIYNPFIKSVFYADVKKWDSGKRLAQLTIERTDRNAQRTMNREWQQSWSSKSHDQHNNSN